MVFDNRNKGSDDKQVKSAVGICFLVLLRFSSFFIFAYKAPTLLMMKHSILKGIFYLNSTNFCKCLLCASHGISLPLTISWMDCLSSSKLQGRKEVAVLAVIQCKSAVKDVMNLG